MGRRNNTQMKAIAHQQRSLRMKGYNLRSEMFLKAVTLDHMMRRATLEEFCPEICDDEMHQSLQDY